MSSLPSLLTSKTAAAMNSESALMTCRRNAISSARHRDDAEDQDSKVRHATKQTDRRIRDEAAVTQTWRQGDRETRRSVNAMTTPASRRATGLPVWVFPCLIGEPGIRWP